MIAQFGRRCLSMLLAMLMVVSLVPAEVFATETEDHDHVHVEETVVESTESEAAPVSDLAEGEITHEHSYVGTVVDPTCVDAGFTAYACECGEGYMGDETPALGHNYVSQVVEPTAEAQGYTQHTCSVCGDSYQDSFTDAVVESEETEPEETEETEPEETEADPALAEFQAKIDDILTYYLGATELTREEIEAKVAAMDTDTIWIAQVEIYDLEYEMEEVLTESQMMALVEQNPVLIDFADVLGTYNAGPNMMATTVTVLDGQVSITDDQNNITVSGDVVTAKVKSSFTTRKTNTLTIVNETANTATLSFDYSASGLDTEDAGSFSLVSSSQSASHTGTHSVMLNAGASMTLSFRAPRFSQTATLVLDNFSLVAAANESEVTFNYDSTLGSVTVGGSAVESGATETVSVTNGAVLVATPNSGTTFLGWINEADNAILSTAASFTLKPSADMTVKPVFIASSTTTPWFMVGAMTSQVFKNGLLNMTSNTYYTIPTGKYLFDDLNAACAAAAAGTSKGVVLMNNATLPSGSYTIPSGVTLLIPFDSANTLYTDKVQTPGVDANNNDSRIYETPREYRVLTMASGASLTVNGALSLSAKHALAQGSRTDGGSPSGDCSFIRMASGSSITVNGALYAYGFITGSGSVTANSGASVYENFQIMDFRGGTQSTDMQNGVFPLSQYYVQNIEVPLTLNYGATEYACTSIIMSGAEFGSAVAFIGPSGCMFNLTSGSVVKSYDGTTDRLRIAATGNMTVDPISMSVGTSTLDSVEYELGVNGNITVAVDSGTITMNQDMALLPGAEITIGANATCNLGAGVNIYVYDTDQWGTYCSPNNKTYIPVTYAPGRAYNRTDADLKDARILVQGTMDASNGFIYTTTGGADICGESGAKAMVTPGSETVTYQLVQNSGYTSIPITSAKLKNGDGTYVETAGTEGEYHYIDGIWQLQCVGENHAYPATGTVTKEPTCTAEGEMTVTCACGATTKTATVAKIAHVMTATPAKDATCAVAGNNAYWYCSTCTTYYSDEAGTTATTVADQTIPATGNHADASGDGNHACDVCGKTGITDCADSDLNHACDECSASMGTHADASGDGNHVCDYGCGAALTGCVDDDKDHTCNECSGTVGEHIDANTDHVCDYGCSDAIGTCGDSDKDHDCDYGCSKYYGEHADANTDHVCDYGCSVAMGTCEDTDLDHKCDYGCDKVYGTCADADKDHACDYGCDLYFGVHEDTNTDHVCDHGCSVAIGTCEDKDLDHDCDYGCSKYYGEHVDANTDHTCDYGCDLAIGTCEDTDKDHDCDYGCSKYYGEHIDGNTDHVCDYGCTVAIGEHADADKDHVCDYGCGDAIGEHIDANTDHNCDYGCSVKLGTCGDADQDHACDYGCGKSFGTCEDTDSDHKCDYGCGKEFGDHSDSDNDHVCDYGCSAAIGEHADGNNDHVCDYGCGDAIGACEDKNLDHTCDYGCGKDFGEHTDSDNDHVCDYGCSAAIGTCEDADKDHACDYGCDKYFGTHSDADLDHNCNYGCSVKIGDHTDSNKDHACDYGCNEAIGEHADGNNDHVCDYGCTKAIGACSDADLDHKCDYGCGKEFGTHEDTNSDHKCEYGCSAKIGDHTDSNKDHACDYGCFEKIGTCEDSDLDHACDYGCSKVYGTHADSATDKDHVCDYGCGAILSECVDTDKDHACDNGCDASFGNHEDTDLDHNCDYGCAETIGDHTDSNNDHVCEYGCTVAIGVCEDKNKDHTCDYGCGASFGTHADSDKDHVCDYGCTVAMGTCEDADFDHACDYGCDKVYGVCEDADYDHDCDYGCSVTFGTHEDINTDHNCDYGCDVKLGDHVDAGLDHKCDYGCVELIGTCEDKNKDHKCDYGCTKYYGTHADAGLDHACDYSCSEKIGVCEDKNLDHTCDYGCGASFGTHGDADHDHTCDYGCSVAIGTCEDKNQDHACDYGCSKVYGTHADPEKDGDHVCDYCGAAMSECSDSDTDKDHKCEECGKDGITDHVWVDADCVTPKTCSVCAAIDGEPLGHDMEETPAKAKTCTEDGTNGYFTCKTCTKVFKDALGETVTSVAAEFLPAGHDLVYDDSIKPTCTEAGEAAGSHCTSCDYFTGHTVIPALGHDWDDGVILAGDEPTCTATGTKTFYCKRTDCSAPGATKEETVDALGHTMNHTAATAPTCALPGNNEYYTCGTCDLVFTDVNGENPTTVADQVIPATGAHTDAPADGNHDCDVCGKTGITVCDDADKDHSCDDCGATGMGTHEDADHDHACDYGCSLTIGDHEDADHDHECDYGCSDKIGTCGDADHDHDCDYGCDMVYGTCEDTDLDHTCDYGCGKSYGTCEDTDLDHKCDYGCDKPYGTCADSDKDHKCDYGCGMSYGSHTDSNKDHKCDYGCSEAIGTCEDTNTDHKCDYGCAKVYGTCEDTDLDHACDYGCAKVYGTCEDSDLDHDCDYGCAKVYGTCEDTDLDHDCDYGCGKVYGDHVDAGLDHKCDYGCAVAIGTCEDKDLDHACDYGCAKVYGTCEDNDLDHDCDYGCDKIYGTCEDTDLDHECDYGCGKVYGTCEDTDLDHKCDYGCGMSYGSHTDSNKDHACDYGCSVAIGTCEDKDLDHDCDYGCGKVYGTCEDTDLDHDCDYGCDKVYGTCEDKDLDHDCDYGCAKYFGTCVDVDLDHACDYGCDKVYGTCEDTDLDHDCDYGCDKVYGDHVDADKDHDCDYGCTVAFGTCADSDKDHACDYGCDKVYGDHVDAGKDHICDYGCSVAIGTCEDKDLDHDCDYGCTKVYGEHTDADKDHDCDYGCSVAIGTCADGDKDHDCDYGCDKVYGDHVDADKNHVCDYGCAVAFGTCADSDKDHKCDYGCDKVYGAHIDADKDHDCDYGCSEAIGTCADGDKDHQCDYGCGKTYGDHTDVGLDHKCDYGCAVSIGTCADSDKDHKCDYGCGKTYGSHGDANKDHKCDYGCSEAIGTCEDADKDHKCDYGCGKKYGEHVDSDKDHVCDYGCDLAIGTCEDADKDHDCDYGCAKVYGIHADPEQDGDHVCDYCGAAMSDCSDSDTDQDHKCEECGKDGITAHVWVDADCVTPKTCSVCAATDGESLGHDMLETPAKAATCTEDGTNGYFTCKTCTKVFKDALGETVTSVAAELLESSGHDMDHIEEKESSCTVNGNNEYYICSVCDKAFKDAEGNAATTVEAETLPLLPHTEVTDEARETSCKEPGLTEGSHCSVCGTVLVAQQEIPALAHNVVYDAAEDPTCVLPGLTRGSHCSVCGTVLVAQEEIPAKGHTLSEEYVPAKKPTYTGVGWEAYQCCTVCSYTTRVEIPMLETPVIKDYETFVTNLALLEEMAYAYLQESPGKDPLALIIKYIRTGVDRYNSGSWGIMAGYEDTGFATFVAKLEDEINSQMEDETQFIMASGLKNIENFTLPNGDYVDFGHMFGTMDITYHNNGSVNHADVAGWAGDLVDLLSTSDRHGVTGTVEEMVTDIAENYLNKSLNESDIFSLTDMYGDLDGFYVMQKLYSQTYETGTLTSIVQDYFVESLTDEQRADYFLRNRLNGVSTRNDVRNAVYNAYTGNKVVSTLEGTREFTSDNLDDLKKACCYAFADYLCRLAGDFVEVTDNPYYTVFSSKSSTLAPGITQEIKMATSADDNQMVFYLATADLTRSDVDVYANYNNNDPAAGWAMQRVLDQANAAQNKYGDPESEYYIENYNVIASINGAGFNMSTGEPGGLLVMHGIEYQAINANGFFGILKNGKAVIGTTEEYNTIYKDQVQEGIAGFGTTLVKDGAVCITRTDDYYSNRASRTAVGITRTGKVVFMVLDGRQGAWSCGGSMEEIAQIMLEAGCVHAINLDGGGSTTYVAKQEGEDALTVVNKPSDGVERSVSTSLIMVSTAPSSTAFHHAVLESATDYMTIGTSQQITANGVSATGNAAELPEGTSWAVSDERWGAITEDGIFTALRTGDVEINLMLGEEIIGSKTMHIVSPTQVYFTRTNMNAVYGQSVVLPVKALYEGKEVTIQATDLVFTMNNPEAGSIDGFNFTGSAEGGVKVVEITATLANDASASATITVNLYNHGENTFDFDQATGGSRQLAWDRQVSNSTTDDEITYTVVDENEDMVTSYVFAIDMTQIPFPEELSDLIYMLPGADMEGASAWNFLLQLAERVSVLTWVKPVIRFDPNFDVDYSGLKVINEYFDLTDVSFDDTTNSLTLTLNWIDQTMPIDASMANPLCLVSGIKLTPKADAAWDAKSRLTVVNSGEIGYEVYLRASGLYSFCLKPENQATYGLQPFVNPNDESEKGGYFGDIYSTFEDTYTLINSVKNGWYNEDGGFAYYENGEKYTGIRKVDGLYYDFGETGINVGKTPYSGLFQENGSTFYAKNGALVNGWQGIGDDWYLFSWTTYAGVDGTYNTTIAGVDVTYEMEDGLVVKGHWHESAEGLQYFYGPYYYQEGWKQIDGKSYFFEEGYAYTGVMPVRGAHAVVATWYEFDENGAMVGLAKDGLYWHDGYLYYVENANSDHYGLYYIDGNYYYFKEGGKAVVNQTYWITYTNGLEPEVGTYRFAADGKMLMTTEVVNENGTYYYYCNGKRTSNAGLIIFNGDYYNIEKGAIASTNKTLWVELTNGLKSKGVYSFDEEAKMILYNGIVNGYYYVEGEKTAAGLLLIDGNYYYAGSGGKLVTSQAYWITQTNGLKDVGTYRFDAEGKMYLTTGVVNEGGTLYYYQDGKRTNGGLVEHEGNYYYFVSGATAFTNGTTWVSKTNGLVSEGTYRFRADGRMIMTTEVVDENGTLYYYCNGKRTANAGIVEFNGYYYYIGSGAKAAVSTTMWVSKTNDLIPVGSYTFDEEGKLYLHHAILNGCYYYDGEKTAAGLVLIDGKYYYAGYNGKLVVSHSYWITQTNDLLPAGTYRFRADGSIIMTTEVVNENGVLYYYENGKRTADAGVMEINGYYYYIGSGAIAVAGKTAWVSVTNGLVPAGTYRFAADGKMIMTTGIVNENGTLYYYQNGRRAGGAGLIQMNGAYYYIDGGAKAAANTTTWVSNTNGLVPAGSYSFDAEGKMIMPDGIVNGYYYSGGVKTAAGLILIDGSYYYAGYNGKLVVSQSYWITQTNGLLTAGTYRFDAEGKILMTTEIVNENGTLYYYRDGKRTTDAGVLEIDGSYYYVGSGGVVTAGKSAWVSITNGLVTAGTYRFAADGKMIMTTEVVEESGILYYYLNGKRTANAGLVLVDGAYYYIDSAAKAVTNTTMVVSKTNGLMAEGEYTFGADGKLVP